MFFTKRIAALIAAEIMDFSIHYAMHRLPAWNEPLTHRIFLQHIIGRHLFCGLTFPAYFFFRLFITTDNDSIGNIEEDCDY